MPILPIDSEHNAVHQCLRVGTHPEVKFIWLTASGGPFRQLPLEKFADITPEQALKLTHLGHGPAHYRRLRIHVE